MLLNLVEEGNLFDPATSEFQSRDNFSGEELAYDKQKIGSFYSRFQIYWLEILNKSFSITLNLAGEKIKVSTSIVLIDTKQIRNSFSLAKIDDFAARLKEVAKKELEFDLEKKKEMLRKNYKEFDKFLKFLLLAQSAYFPYAKSGGRTIKISGNPENWMEAKRNFKLKSVLNKTGLRIEDVAKWYKRFSHKAQNLLGIKEDDWVQLWKNIAWQKKDKLEGSVRLGVEYLQWAVMLKRILEEHLQKKILDIDEMSVISEDDVLKFDPLKIDDGLRAFRNKRYSDNKKNYYYDCYKRLFYLANDLGLDYQPRVMVFVEGKTEEIVFAEIFEWYVGNKPENLGIEFVNIGGINKFFGKEISIKDSNNKYRKRFINNFNHLISYNLNKWQVRPFFIGDGENNITFLVKNGVSISFNQNQYLFPQDWQFIWGMTNSNQPFKGKDFETANFNDAEIATVLSGILQKQVTAQQVKEKREKGEGIKQIDTEVEEHKIEIARKLCQNLFDKYKKERNKSVFERPIFKVINMITNLAVLNHPPVDREVELINKAFIEKELKKLLSSSQTLSNSPQAN